MHPVYHVCFAKSIFFQNREIELPIRQHNSGRYAVFLSIGPDIPAHHSPRPTDNACRRVGTFLFEDAHLCDIAYLFRKNDDFSKLRNRIPFYRHKTRRFAFPVRESSGAMRFSPPIIRKIRSAPPDTRARKRPAAAGPEMSLFLFVCLLFVRRGGPLHVRCTSRSTWRPRSRARISLCSAGL